MQKLQEIAEQLGLGKNVQNRKLQAWLSADGYELYLAAWAEQQEIRDTLKAKPAVVQEYEELLRTATFWHNRAVAAEARGQASHSELDDRATDYYERALERLEESVHNDASLHAWFDRDLDFSVGSDLQANAGSMPIVITSRSADNRGGGLVFAKQTKQEVKLAAVEREILNLEADVRGTAVSLGDLLGRDVGDD
ncbi:hypothetical protein [Shimia sp. SK013]|uniref:hypothetical protein n=1 Tax=Shimia sp. SK013 TaxID=1389006 RepID=UPI00128F274C|nr:hypothetical protein [Shimia sp. SK013]